MFMTKWMILALCLFSGISGGVVLSVATTFGVDCSASSIYSEVPKGIDKGF